MCTRAGSLIAGGVALTAALVVGFWGTPGLAGAVNGRVAYVALPTGFQSPFVFQPYDQPESVRLFHGALVVAAPGGRPRRVPGVTGRRPAWAPAGDRLAFVRASNAGVGLYTVRADGRGMRRLYVPSGDDDAGVDTPAWAPDGSALVFERDRWHGVAPGDIPIGNEVVSDLWTVRSDGTGLRRLTRLGAATEPTWGPGGRIAFVAQGPQGNWDIFVIGADGRGLARLTTGAGDHRDPAWSPDGTRLAASVETAGKIDVVTIAPDGTDVRPVTSAGPGEAYTDPAWAPDCTAIAVAAWTATGNDQEIAVVPAAGGIPRALTANRTDDLQPTWELAR